MYRKLSLTTNFIYVGTIIFLFIIKFAIDRAKYYVFEIMHAGINHVLQNVQKIE